MRRILLSAQLFATAFIASMGATGRATAQDAERMVIDVRWAEIKVWEKTEFDRWLTEATTKHDKQWSESALKKRLEERGAALANALSARRAKAEGVVGQRDDLLSAEWELTEAELELSVRNADRIVILKKFHEKARTAEEQAKARVDAGKIGTDAAELSETKALRLKVEIALEREFDRGKLPADEVAVMAARERAVWQTFRKVRSLFEIGAKGGETEKHGAAAREWLLARGRLALRKENGPAALADLKLGCWFGKRCVEANQSAYDVGTVSIDLVLEAQRGHEEVQLEFLRTYRVFGDAKKPIELPDEPSAHGGDELKQAAR